MHNLKPNTKYKIVTIQMACEESIGESGIADGINDMLNIGLINHPNNCFYSDWAIDFSGPVEQTGAEPTEGELFQPVKRYAL